MILDLDRALVKLQNPVRLCVVLSYHEGMSHGEIAKLTRIPLGTVKSHIRNGAHQLQELLSAYDNPSEVKNS
jgi:RNA polymerase sigma-70 factor (ECF subfamily)